MILIFEESKFCVVGKLNVHGESEWVEIDSDEITYFIADHQDQFDTGKNG